ncbi:MAG: FeoA domain-containing protein [Thermodesulfobacteriota bacterium]|nr:FeoA domain-containing protein [Thermodesulfobacteriota bacterium]
MSTRHEHEKKQFKKLFKQQGIDDFDKRFQVLEAFLKTEKHVTCQEIFKELEKENFSIGLGFIAETMELLCRFGFAHKVKFDEGPPRYEHRHLGLHHDHMICTKCGKIIEFRDEALERLQADLAAAYGFYMLQHKMCIYGLCSECQDKRDLPMSLVMAKPGENLKLRELKGGKKAQMRLSSMGLRIGDTIEVVSVQTGGQMVIAAGDHRFVIGQGLGHKIMVSRIERTLQESPLAEQSGEKMLLSEMKQGQEGVIVRVAGKSFLRRRLLEMGLNRGTKVFVEKYAPLRDPLELILKGYHISLRVEEASHISMENVTKR